MASERIYLSHCVLLLFTLLLFGTFNAQACEQMNIWTKTLYVVVSHADYLCPKILLLFFKCWERRKNYFLGEDQIFCLTESNHLFFFKKIEFISGSKI